MKTGKTVLVTGACGGIGRNLCREFARRGYRLVVSDIDRKPLGQFAALLSRRFGVSVIAAPMDLSLDAGPERLYRKIRAAGISVDILVNNAGFGLGGYFSDNNPKTVRDMMRVNMDALTTLCRLFGRDMLRRGHGKILNLASLGSFVPGPMNSVYCATKAYVLSLSEALSEEMSGGGVQVTAVCPGGTDTNFARRAGMEHTPLFRFCVLRPEYVAREAVLALMQGKRVAVIGAPAKVMTALTRFLPRIVVTKTSGLIQTDMRRMIPRAVFRAATGRL